MDIPHDNMLDAAEFAVAMHLLRGYLRGLRLPPVLPPALRLPALEEICPPAISVRELLAYSQLFEVLDTTHLSFIDGQYRKKSSFLYWNTVLGKRVGLQNGALGVVC